MHYSLCHAAMPVISLQQCSRNSAVSVFRSRNKPSLANLRLQPFRTSLAAPKSRETLLNRRSDRELPQISSPWLPWLRTFPIFVAIVTVSALGIFNYQKTSSSVVASTLYALRTSDVGRHELGDEIYFRDKWPWIWGELNQLKGRINIAFAVKGTKASGIMRFRCRRRERMGFVSRTIIACLPCFSNGRYVLICDLA